MNRANSKHILQQIPQVDALLRERSIAALTERHSCELVTSAVRMCVETVREQLLSGAAETFDRETLLDEIIARADLLCRPNQRTVINATGILLHTNLGRAVMDKDVAEQVKQAAMCYTNLEYNLETGERGSRHTHVEGLLCALSGAEAAFAVNNNAAAVLLMLAALTQGGQVIVSRGELVEIGGSFRVPDIMLQSGADLVEVGTTNKTCAQDYIGAIDAQRTAALLKVHTSNFKMIGFTEEVSLTQLAEIGHAQGLPVLYDLGSGSFSGLDEYGIHGQQSAADCIRTGADVVCFSGDKLLGGPQAGILIGKKTYIDRMKRHPLARALRIDKLTLTALEATLRIHQDPKAMCRSIPIFAMLALDMQTLWERGNTLLNMLHDAHCAGTLSLCETTAQIGGGSVPGEVLPSVALCISPCGMSADEIQQALRSGSPPIIARISKDRVLFDLRTMQEREFAALAARLCAILGKKGADA